MAAISTIVGIAGLAAAGVGAYRSYSAAGEYEEASERAMQVGQQGSQMVYEGTKQVEEARKEQDRLNFLRERRRIFREAQIARSQAVSRATFSNAQYGSALPGAYGQIAGREGQQLTALTENLNVGGRIYSGNALASEGRALESQGSMLQASARNSYQTATAEGQGLFSLGTSLVNNAPTIQNIGQSLFGSRDTYFSGGFMNTVSRSGFFG